MIGSSRVRALWGIVSLGGLFASVGLAAPVVAESAAAAHQPKLVAPGLSPPDSLVGPERVPFVGQTPLLCGGAAAAMLLRFFGERHVYGEEFQDLVRREAGGIATNDLAAAMRNRGYRVRTIQDDGNAAFEALAQGVPVMLLLDGDPTLHYVLLVRASPTHVWIHDPNFGPNRRMTRSKLAKLRAESGFWTLVAAPDDPSVTSTGGASGASGPPTASGVTRADSATRSTHPSSSDAGVRAGDPEAEDALEALRRGDHERARRNAFGLLAGDSSKVRLGRRILATSYHLEGRARDALVEWNHLGEPRLELLEVRGADHTRHHVLARRAGLDVGDMVTPRGTGLASRRLTSVPAVRSARMDYVPLPDGSAEVRGFVDERDRWPGLAELASAAVGAATDGGADLEAGPFLALGDRWRLERSWREAQTHGRMSGSFASERLPGIVSVSVDWLRERHVDRTSADRSATTSERRRRALGFAEWVSPTLRLDLAVGLEDWTDVGDDERQYSVGLGTTWRSSDDGMRLNLRAEHWRGALDPFTRLEAGLLGRFGLTPAIALRLEAGAIAASTAAPRTLWPGAGVGEVRGPLLRGHPLTRDGVIDGAAFGRRLVHATTEVRLQRRFGPLLYGASLFTDVAEAWRTGLPGSPGPTGSAGPFVDPGIGLFLDTADRELRLDLARGGGGWTLSAGVRARR